MTMIQNTINVGTQGAAEASRVLKPTPGRLFSITYVNGNAALRYLQVFDATALPAAGAIPVLSIPVAAGAVVTLQYPWAFGSYFTNGIVVANSSTQFTLTVGAADAAFYAVVS